MQSTYIDPKIPCILACFQDYKLQGRYEAIIGLSNGKDVNYHFGIYINFQETRASTRHCIMLFFGTIYM
jgi:hypothetical protein